MIKRTASGTRTAGRRSLSPFKRAATHIFSLPAGTTLILLTLAASDD
jgi:hypothetical protein